ncbi:MAG: hypothetical protein CMA77_05245 [Euryarchaeota archaeon]|nr:hypothetical protein [Euryarchaeota archaeon]
MPDLIIKPENTSGNKVKIQDQGAVTRLQTDDAGITITAPTIADLSNVSGTLPVGVTGGSGLTALGTISAGDISAGMKFFTHTHTTDFYDGGNGVFAFGTSLSITSSDNPNGAKFLIWVGGGKWVSGNTAISFCPSVRVKEGSDFGSPGTYEGYSSYGSGTSTDGDTTLTHVYLSNMIYIDGHVPGLTSLLLYHNNSGSATSLYIRSAADIYDQAGQNPRWNCGGDFTDSNREGVIGIGALKVA